MRTTMRLVAMLVLASLVQTGRADTVELRNGTTVEGKYAGECIVA